MKFELAASPHAQLWETAKNALNYMLRMFGEPSAIACLKLLVRARRLDILGWLKPIEDLVRRLIIIEAMKLELKAIRPHAPLEHVRREIVADPADSASWPARFQVFPANSHNMRSSKAAAPEPFPLFKAFPVAERFEAVLRVLENPGRYISRAARRAQGLRELPRALARRADPEKYSPCRFALDETRELLLSVLPIAPRSAYDSS